VVVESAIDFLPLHIYQSPRERYVFPLDWELALAQPEVAWSIQEYKLMALFARAGYLADDALVTTRLLCDADEFAVLESAHHQWLERRVRTDSTWSVTPVEGGSSRLWLVRRRGLRSCAGISAEEPLVHPDRAAADR
ncbi:MAG TPA: hypothetical protein VHM30_09400, partial [Gemmatimonadaceae bacterium]|nr:hypothetical protein [Gemmatimonadaceae bacterium]